MKLKPHLFLALVTSLFIISCSSDEGGVETSNSGNDQSRRKRMKSYTLSSSYTDSPTTWNYTYNSDGLLIAITDQETGRALNSYEYEGNKLTKERKLNIRTEPTSGFKTELIIETSYKYDSQNRLARRDVKQTTNSLSKDEEFDRTNLYSYENKKIIIETIFNDPPAQNDSRNILNLNENNEIFKIEFQSKSKDSNAYKTIKETNLVLENGLIIEAWNSFLNPTSEKLEIEEESRQQFVYNENGDVIEKYSLSPDRTRGLIERVLFRKFTYTPIQFTPYAITTKEPTTYDSYLNLTFCYFCPLPSESNTYYESSKNYSYTYLDRPIDNLIQSNNFKYEVDEDGYLIKSIQETFNHISGNISPGNILIREYILE